MNMIHTAQSLPLAHTFTTSRGVRTSTSVVIVIMSDGVHTGYGTCVPEEHKNLTAARLQKELDDLMSQKSPDILYDSLTQSSVTSEQLRISNNTMSGLVMAALDLHCKRTARPLYQLLNRHRLPIYSYKTLQLSDVAHNRKSLEPFMQWRGLKVKTGPELDIRALDALRERFSGQIIIDANGSWDLSTAIKNVKILDNLGINIIEEPVTDYEPLLDSYLPKNSQLFADESCVSPKDIERLSPFIDGVVLKQNKCGGIWAVQNMSAEAKRRNLQVMLGCKVESIIGILAASHLAEPDTLYDLDGHTFLEHDIFQGACLDPDIGKLNIPDDCGIGAKIVSTLVNGYPAHQ